MSTVEDFENAPSEATATHKVTGSRAVKIVDDCWLLSNGFYVDDEEMENYTLDTPAPTTAREALALAWDLAHEVKEGQVIPRGTQYLEFNGYGLRQCAASRNMKVSPGLVPLCRTLDPLPEPDWIDAPAVLAGFDGWSHDEREVFVPTGPHNHWTRVGSSLTSHWSDLGEVTPLYPKGQEA